MDWKIEATDKLKQYEAKRQHKGRAKALLFSDTATKPKRQPHGIEIAHFINCIKIQQAKPKSNCSAIVF